MRIDFILFNKILRNSDIINDNWKKEINKWLVFIKNKGELKRFIPRLTKMSSRKINEVLAEISSAYLLESILNLKITGWEVPIYCEVKSPSWQSELSKKEKLGIRKAQGKYKKTKFGFLVIGRIFDMQLKKLIQNF